MSGTNGDTHRLNGYLDHGPALRLPPQNLEAERAVIGSVLCDWSLMGEVAGLLAVEDFYRGTHQILWRELISIYADGGGCDALILHDRLKPDDRSTVGGVDGISEVVESVPHAVNAGYYAEVVRQKATARRVIEAANETLREGYSDNFTGDQLAEANERRAFAVSAGAAAGTTVDARQMMAEVRAADERRRRGEVVGLSSGIGDLDGTTGGFQPGNLVYVAGRTSMGKTALALNMVEHNSVNMRTPVLFVSLEMNRVEIGQRLAVARSRISGHKYRDGWLNEGERRRLDAAEAEIAGAPLFVDDTPGRNVVQVAANARRHRSNQRIEMLVVDLINHVEGDDPKQNRREQLTVISRRLKGVARELAIPVLALAQLNRQPDAREGNRPRLSDLKECGGLEEDADLVLLLHRPDYYDPNDCPGEATVIVAKNRNGPTEDVPVTFLRECMRFESRAPFREFEPVECPAF